MHAFVIALGGLHTPKHDAVDNQGHAWIILPRFCNKEINWYVFKISEIDVGIEYGISGKCAISKHKFSAFARRRFGQHTGFGHRAIFCGVEVKGLNRIISKLLWNESKQFLGTSNIWCRPLICNKQIINPQRTLESDFLLHGGTKYCHYTGVKRCLVCQLHCVS
jgi:hypothetical protein